MLLGTLRSYAAALNENLTKFRKFLFAFGVVPVALPSRPKQLSWIANLDILTENESFALSGCTLLLTKDSALGHTGESILLPLDNVMFPSTILNRGWQLEELEFLSQHIEHSCTYALLDIGANVGLFTRQAGLRFPNIKRFYCIEPDANNFNALKYNLNVLQQGTYQAWNVALSDSNEEREFFRDTTNFGNYSLNSDAMRGLEFQITKVHSVDTASWLHEIIELDGELALIWKSDTQGYDELVISLTPWDVWNSLHIAIIELWRIKKPAFDVAAFRERIEAFPNRSIGGKITSSVDEIIEFLAGDDWRHDDLYLWR